MDNCQTDSAILHCLQNPAEDPGGFLMKERDLQIADCRLRT